MKKYYNNFCIEQVICINGFDKKSNSKKINKLLK